MAKTAVLTVMPLRGFGGPPIQHANFLRQINADDGRFEFHTLVGEGHPMADGFAEVSTVHTLPDLPTVPRTYSPLRLLGYRSQSRQMADQIAELIKRIDAKLIYSFVESYPAAMMGGRRAGVATAAHVLGMSIFRPKPVAVGWAKVLRKLCDRIVGCQEVIADNLAELGVPRAQLDFVYNGVDLDQVRADADAGPQPDLPADTLSVGMVAGMDPRKGHINLIQAAATVCEQVDNVHFYSIGNTAGDDAYFQSLTDEVKRLGLEDRYHFTGRVDSAHAWVDAMDVYCNPSFTEALSIAVIEAMSLGKPIVATGIEGNLVQVEPGVNGLLSGAADPPGLAKHLVTLLGDADMRRRFGEASREKSQRMFTLKATSEKLAGIMADLTGIA